MGISAASPDHLDAYVRASRNLNESLRRRLGPLVDGYADVVPRLQWGEIDASAALAACISYIDLNHADDAWVAAVAGAFRAADGGDGGVVSVDSAAIDAALRSAGVATGPRADLTVDDPILAGAPPTSGFADDPVCTATGHFVEHEVDLAVPARVRVAGWSRTYSSRWLVAGPFGRGWASWASMRVEWFGSGASVVLADGRRAVFVRSGDGGFPRVPGLFADLVAVDTGWGLRWFDQDRWDFDEGGRIVSVRSPARGDATFARDGEGLRRIEHEGGRWVELDWERGRVSAVRSSDGRIVRYRYDDAGDLIEVDGPGVRRRYEVQDGLVVAVVDADGVEVARNGYDPDGRVRWQRSPFGRCTRFRYPGRGITVVEDDDAGGPAVTHVHDPGGRLFGAIDHHGARFTKEYDPSGHPIAMVDRAGGEVGQTWDERGRLLRREEPGGAVTTFQWDDQDRIVGRTDPAGATVRLSYRGTDREPCRFVDACGAVTHLDVVAGQVMGITDPDGVVTRFERNGDGLVTAVVDGVGGRSTFSYDGSGALTAARSADGAETRFEPDERGRLVRRVDADGTSVGFEWTAAGRLAASISAVGARSVFRYGPHGEVVEVEDAAGEVSRLVWDRLGHLVAMTNPAGTTVRHRYDGLGRLVSTVDGTGAELRREHDAEGRVTALVNGEGQVLRREYDDAGRLTAEIDGEGRVARIERDAAGRVVACTQPDGATTRWRYDAAGRVVAVTDGTEVTTRFRWTPAGRLRSVTDPSGGVTRHRYDRAGRLVEVVGSGGRRERYGLDEVGRVIEVVAGAGERTRFERDERGRVVARTDPAGRTVQLAYHPSGRVASCTCAAGGTSWFRWDACGRLASAVDANGGETRYHWDRAGFLTGVTDPLGGQQTQVNDPMGRLVGFIDQLGHRTQVFLDRAGRVAGHRDATGAEVRFARDGAGRVVGWTTSPEGERVSVVSAGWASPTVLSAGERVAGRVRHSDPQWDAAGQLIAWRDADGRPWTRGYDAAGRMTRQTSPAGDDRLTYDAAGRLVEVVRKGAAPAVTMYRYDAAGRRTREMRCELGRVSSVRYCWDGLGRLREIHRGDGRVRHVTRIEVDPLGRLLSVEGDLGELEWLHHRVLDTATASFLSPDPLAGVPGTPVFANPYHHAANDPVRLCDPLGLRPMTDADLEALRESAGRPVWQKAYDSAADLVADPIGWAADHWETIAAAGLIVVGGVLVATGVGAPIGAGILVGASMSFAAQVALTGEVDQRSLLVSTAAGAIGGAVGGATSAMTVGSQMAIAAGTDAALSAGSQYALTGTIDPHQLVLDGTIGAATAGAGTGLTWAPETHPFGFSTYADYADFGRELRRGLAAAGYHDADAFLRGSSITGVRYKDNVPISLDKGPNDFDLAVSGDSLFGEVKALGIKLIDRDSRTKSLRSGNSTRMRLYDLEQSLTERTGRKVNFMVYRDEAAVAARRSGPYKRFPE